MPATAAALFIVATIPACHLYARRRRAHRRAGASRAERGRGRRASPSQLAAILAYADQVQRVDTRDAAAASRATPRGASGSRASSRRRAAPSLPRTIVLDRAPAADPGARLLQGATGARLVMSTSRRAKCPSDRLRNPRRRRRPARRLRSRRLPRGARADRTPRRALHAFLTVDRRARSRAPRELDRNPPRRRAAAGRPGRASRTTSAPAGVPTTAGSRLLEHYVPPYSATVRRAPRARRRGHRRQDQLRRVRDGILDRALGVRSDAQSLGHRPHARRIERRARRRRSRRAWCRSRSGPIPAARSASRPRSAACSA